MQGTKEAPRSMVDDLKRLAAEAQTRKYSQGIIETDFGGCIVEADKRLQQAKEKE